LAPALYIVATPIGNMGDITLRALEVLRGVDLIAAEDTRHSRGLLSHFGISTPVTAYHEHSSERVRERLLARILAGERGALISGAGTTSALTTFFNDPVSAGIAAGIVYFPTLKAFGIPCDVEFYKVLDVPVADMKKYNWGMVKPMYYARHGAQSANAEVRPAQTLDIVPVAGGQNVFQVFFNGKPLKGEKLMVYAPNTWAKEYKTDAEGKVKLETPWAGQYVLEVIHTDKTPGKFEGKDYESVRHRATYTFKKELPHPPAPSP